MSLASYASLAHESKGRLYKETSDILRSTFQRDRDRIVHSNAFRRLQYKTQVFVYHEGDHYRSRLTHSLEVAQISRSIARQLHLDEDLAEAIALAHDFGHTPFGHAGEQALNSVMPKEEGFDHNAQSFDILTQLEQRYALFDGLNLSWEALEGLVKHNGPLNLAKASSHMKSSLSSYIQRQDLELTTYAGLEAQVAALADDIAYHSHDIDDGLRAGLLSRDVLSELPFLSIVFTEVEETYQGISPQRLVHEFIRRLISIWIYDVVDESKRRLQPFQGCSVADIRQASSASIAFSESMAIQQKTLKKFLYEKMYYHDKLKHRTEQAYNIVTTLYKYYKESPLHLPLEWQEKNHLNGLSQARNIANYIAGMTDRFALTEYQRIINE